VQSSNNVALGSATQDSVTITPGASTKVNVTVPTSSSSNDLSGSLAIGGHSIPITVRGSVDASADIGNFTGSITGGNGRGGAMGVAQMRTVYFDVPQGKQHLDVDINLSGRNTQFVEGYLVAPTGRAASLSSNAVTVDGDGAPVRIDKYLENHVVNPIPGQWHYVLVVRQTKGTTDVAQQYLGSVSTTGYAVQAVGLPTSAKTVLKAGQSTPVTISVTNGGSGDERFFLSARGTDTVTTPLLGSGNVSGKVGVVHGKSDAQGATYLVPPSTTSLEAHGTGSSNIAIDLGGPYGGPEYQGDARSTTAKVVATAPDGFTPGRWSAQVTPSGQFHATTPITGSSTVTAVTSSFDTAIASDTGDLWRFSVDKDAPAFKPVEVPSFGTKTITARITPNRPKGTVVTGVLYVNSYQIYDDAGSDVIALPYEYTVG
jgi:hypothetical protein